MDAPSLTGLEWDSAFFGFPIGLIAGDRLERDSLAQTIAHADQRRLSCVYLLVDAADVEGSCNAQALGFSLVDIRVELDRPLGAAEENGGEVIRAADESDRIALEELARERFTDSRFFADPGFPRDRARELYAAWVRRAFETPAERITLVARDVAGFVTCHADAARSVGTIELIATAPGAEGTGIGRALLHGAHAWFLEQGLRRAAVVTQGRNVAAQRFYQGDGYRVCRTGLWFHRWR